MLPDVLESGRLRTDQALERLLPAAETPPASIHRAMRHSVFAGGKRLRPILAMEAVRLIAGSLPEGIEELGCALEMLHTYSLVHDDLPALDNDDLRRGQPTCHKAFGEATAILAGDALQTLAYQTLSRLRCPPAARVRIIEEIAVGTGTIEGMIGGQVMDLEAEHTRPDAKTLECIHRSKTGALITASVVSGGLYGGASAEQAEKLRSFGRAVGLAFQIADDVLDVEGETEVLGKPVGSDERQSKATYPAVIGIGESKRRAVELMESATGCLEPFGGRGDGLAALARFVVERRH
jgi:geranylgeranyl diphosphate synthase type II